MVDLHEVLIGDIHGAALTDELAHKLDSDRTEVGPELPDGVYPASVSVRLDRRQSSDRKDPDLRPPAYPVAVKKPVENTPYIPETTVWIENPAMVNNRGEKVWEQSAFAEQMVKQVAKVETEDPDAPERFYLTGAKFVEVVDKSYLIQDSEGRMRPSKELYEDHGEMSIAHFTKRPTITNDTVKKKLRERDVLSGGVLQPLRLTRADRVWAKPHTKANTTRRFWTPGQAMNQPGVEPSNVRPRAYKLAEDITAKDEEEEGWVVSDLDVGLDEISDYFPQLSASDLWLKCTFIGDYASTEEFAPEDVVFEEAVPA